MKVVILSGGLGTRLSEETGLKPKPMIEIGGKPILWHIMKIYSQFGLNDFVILVGYKGYIIKEYFSNYYLHQSDFTIDLSNNNVEYHNNDSENWRVTIIHTGHSSMTGARIKKAQEYIGNETFCLTYGDGVANININKLINFHKNNDGILTLTSVKPEGRYGSVIADDNGLVDIFVEKPKGDRQWINGGFMVCDKEVFDYLDISEDCVFERKPLEDMTRKNKVFAYKHNGFWKSVDTLRDKNYLEDQWKSDPKWKIW